jgi:GntR family transcriptional repressor for pyruvate dehydrogenase complex
MRPTADVARLIGPIKKTRLPEEIASRIRMLILDGTFKPGEPLPSERVLAQRFGVSRGSVRDAFRILEMVGLLETRHGQGTFPQELSVENLVTPLASVITYKRDLQEELLDVRRMFEPALARVAAERATESDLQELERILGQQRQKVEAGLSTISEDTAFHSALARATHNEIVVRIMETLNDLLVGSRKLTLQQKGRPLRSMRGHEAVVAALRRHDAEGAAQAMTAHIEQIAEILHLAQEAGAPPTS